MPSFDVTDPKSGKTLTFTGDTPPDERVIADAFSKLGLTPEGPAKGELYPDVPQTIVGPDGKTMEVGDVSKVSPYNKEGDRSAQWLGKNRTQQDLSILKDFGVKSLKPAAAMGIEMLGQTAGDVLGGVGGTALTGGNPLAGFAAGSLLGGLGYAGARKLNDMLGLTDNESNPVRDAALGTALGATARGVVPLWRAGRSVLSPEYRAAQEFYRANQVRPELQQLIDENINSAKTLQNEIPGLQMDYAATTGNPNVARLKRRAVLGGEADALGPQLQELSVNQNTTAMDDYLQNQLLGSGEPQQAYTTWEDLLNSLSQSVADKEADFAGKVARMPASYNYPGKDSGTAVRGMAQQKKRDLGEQVRTLKDAVPADLTVDSSPLNAKVEELFGGYDPLWQAAQITPKNMMTRARTGLEQQPDVLGSMGVDNGSKPMTFQNLMDFNEQVTAAMRNATNYHLRANLGELKQGIEDTIALAAESNPNAAKSLKDYWAFYRDVYIPTIRQNATGKILARDTVNPWKVKDEQVLATILDGKNPQLAAQQFAKTFGDNPAARQEVIDYLEFQLSRALEVSGTQRPENVATQWLNKNRPLLESFGLWDHFKGIRDSAQRLAAVRVGNVPKVMKLLESMSGLSGQELADRALSSTQSMSDMLNMLGGNQRAIEGFKAIIGQRLYTKFHGIQRDVAGNELLINSKFGEIFKTYEPMLTVLYGRNSPEMKAIRNVHEALSRTATGNKPGALPASHNEFVQALHIPGKVGMVVKIIDVISRGKSRDILAMAMYDPATALKLMNIGKATNRASRKALAEALIRTVPTIILHKGQENHDSLGIRQ